MESRKKSGLATKISDHQLIALLLVIAAVWGGISALGEPLSSAYGRLTWRGAEEKKIESLRVGQTVDYIKTTFGEPESAPRSESGVTYYWVGRGYDIMAHAVDDSVTSYIVHVCDPELHPTIETAARKIVANETTFDAAADEPAQVFYNWAPAFVQYFEGSSGSHAEEFRNLIWGASGCNQNLEWLGDTEYPPPLICTREGSAISCEDRELKPISFDSSVVSDLRAGLVVNTIGEGTSIDEFPPARELFTIG